MTHVEVKLNSKNITDIGIWLNSVMPNIEGMPPRWTVGLNKRGNKFGINFTSKKDAMVFKLRWA